MKTLNGVLPGLAEANSFTKLDFCSGYWTLKLSEESSFLNTFYTPYGRHTFLRFPFSLKSSRDEFLRKVYECFDEMA
jgi:hypothetical protein